MEFFRVPCPGRGMVSIDGHPQAENKQAGSEEGRSRQRVGLRVFQCGPGLHDIAMKCLVGIRCLVEVQRVLTAQTNPILPTEVPYTCAP